MRKNFLTALLTLTAFAGIVSIGSIPATRAAGKAGVMPQVSGASLQNGFENRDGGSSNKNLQRSTHSRRTISSELAARMTVNLDPIKLSKSLKPNQIGIGRILDFDFNRQAQTFVDGDMATDLLVVRSPNALGLRVHLEGVSLRDGEELYVFGQSEKASPSLFTEQGPFGNGQFWSDVIIGDTVVIERHRPVGQPKSDASNFRITELSHLVENPKAGLNSVGPCEVDAKCGNQVPERNSVARIIFTSSGQTFACTGTVLATQNNDRSPFVLTANHCVSTAAEAQTVQAFWFYQSIACNSQTLQTGIFASATGAAVLRTDQASDQTLLEILGVIPRTLFYSGWDLNPQAISTAVFSLHHPGSGFPNAENELDSYLRQAVGSISAQSQTCVSTGATNAYQVNWSQGIVESGSDGAAIWASNGGTNFLTGVLTGCGSSACGQPANQQNDIFSRFTDFAPLITANLAGGSDDSFEPNDTRATASVVSGVTASNLVVKQNNEDWYSVTLTPGQTLNATATFTHAFGDIDLELYRNAETSPLAVSDGISNTETISFQNQTGTNTYLLRVLLFNDTRNTYALNLASGACSYSIDPTGATLPATGGTGTVSVTAGSGCPWTAVSNNSFITVTSGTTGTGNGTVGYTVAANTGIQRVGTVTIAGQTFTVTQSNGCTYSINPTSTTAPVAGTTGTVTVTASDTVCPWTAVSNNSFITVTSGATGTGNGTVGYSVAANTGIQRTGTVTIAGQTFTVTQANGCTYLINPTSASATAAGGSGSVTVTASDTACPWTAVSNNSFITVTSGATGTGNGTVGYSVAANTGTQRTGTVTIAGQTFTVTQAAVDCTFDVSPLTIPLAAIGGTTTITVTVGTGCAWTAVSNSPFITVTSEASGSGNGTVQISVKYNNGVPRSGTLTVAGQTVTVNQPARNASTPGQFRSTNGFVYIRNTNDTGFADAQFFYGQASDIPVAGDWDGNGTDTIGIYRNGTFFLRNSNSSGFADIQFPFGAAGDIPIVGDWDGDGIDTIGVVRGNTIFLKNSNSAGNADIQFNYGTSTDTFIVGDWNGDGVDTLGAYRPSNGFVYIRNTNTTGIADFEFFYGQAGDKPVVGDWNGDGIDTIGIVRGNGWYLRNSNTSGFADILFFYGVETDKPITGDWDGL